MTGPGHKTNDNNACMTKRDGPPVLRVLARCMRPRPVPGALDDVTWQQRQKQYICQPRACIVWSLSNPACCMYDLLSMSGYLAWGLHVCCCASWLHVCPYVFTCVHDMNMYVCCWTCTYGAFGFPGLDTRYWAPPPRQGKHRGGEYVAMCRTHGHTCAFGMDRWRHVCPYNTCVCVCMYGASGFPGIDTRYWAPPPRQGKHRGGGYVTKIGMLLGCLSRPPPTYIGSLRPSSVSISFGSGAGLARASGRLHPSCPYKNRFVSASLPAGFPLALRGSCPPRPARPRWKG